MSLSPSSSLTEAVAHLDPDATWEAVQAALTPHMRRRRLRSCSSLSIDATSTNRSNDRSTGDDDDDDEELFLSTMASALWLACDRGHEPAVRFLLQEAAAAAAAVDRRSTSQDEEDTTSTLLPRRLGRQQPQQRRRRIQRLLSLSHAVSGNTAAHYAALSQSLPVFQLLQEYCNNDNEAAAATEFLLLHNRKNHHGDTPLMMACVSRSVQLVRHMLSSSQSTINNNNHIINARNHSNDSALSLSCGHGHVEIVKVLLDHHKQQQDDDDPQNSWRAQTKMLLDIQDDDWQRAQASLHKLNQAVQVQEQNSLLRAHDEPPPNKNTAAAAATTALLLQQKRHDLQLCVTMVREALQRRSDAVTVELLATLMTSEEPDMDPAKSNAVVVKNKSKRRQKPKQKKRTDDKKVRDSGITAVDTTKNNSIEKPTEDTVVLTQLQDGTRAVAVVGVDEEEEEQDETLGNPTTTRQRPTPDDLLLSSLRTTMDDVSQDMMQALCLDASLLLQTPHGLALHCSPAQLDGIETVLQRQLGAVQQARTIHQRVRACRTTTTTTTTSSNSATKVGPQLQ